MKTLFRLIYGDAWKNKDWGGIVGMTILLLLFIIPYAGMVIAGLTKLLGG
jgi:hypothetical protein